MRAAVLLIGDELLGGVTSDRNTATIARALGPRGVVLDAVEIVGDGEEAIAAAALRLAAGRDLLVICGGLGPTEDDRTRHGMARALGVGLREDPEIRAAIEARLASRGIPPAGAARQASFPLGTEPVPNRVGSAPGFRGTLGGCAFWVVPGVPEEAREMVGAMAEELPVPEGIAWERMIATAGLGETRVAAALEEAGFRPPPGVSLGFLPSPGGVRLRLSAPGGVPAPELDAAAARVRAVLGRRAMPALSLEESLIAALSGRGATFATAESCTGGLIGARITDVPGASSVYLGGVVTYSDRAKTERLGVAEALLAAHGAVSEAVAAAMAEGCLRAFGSSLAVSVTGIAGPSGGTPEKPVGTVWIGLADSAGSRAESFRFGGTRDMIRERTVNKALEIAYRRLIGAAG
ncbi:MAG TPA: nicotinamide-nucleotide amidohydrolase family protein [bacterium]|nr:nicotinamide-nucleotide amidohydrolase family protein [bacterium]